MICSFVILQEALFRFLGSLISDSIAPMNVFKPFGVLWFLGKLVFFVLNMGLEKS